MKTKLKKDSRNGSGPIGIIATADYYYFFF